MYEALLKQTAEYQKIAASLASPGPAALFGLPPAGRALVYALLARDLGRPLCIVTPGEAEATHFADDLKTLGVAAGVFPPRDFMLRPVEGASREYEYRRLSVLGALAGGRLKAVCVPVEALLQYTVPRAEFMANTLTLKPGMQFSRDALVGQLFAAGYVRRSQVEGPGQFSVRGDIVDIYAPDMASPARLEFWDEEIDSIASFDLMSQRRDASLQKIYLSPAREVLFGSCEETAGALRAAIKKARGKHRAALEQAMAPELAQLDAGQMPEAMDKYYGIRYPQPATLLDHMDAPLLILDEVGGIRDAQKAAEYRRGEELTGLLEEGLLCPGLDVLYQTMAGLAAAAEKYPTLLCENFLRGMNEFKLKDLINAEAHVSPSWNGELRSLLEDLDPMVEQGYAVTLYSGTPKGAAALTRDLTDKGYTVSMSRDIRPSPGLVQVLPGHLNAGCTLPFARCAVLTSRRHGIGEGDEAKAKKRKKNKDALSSLADVKPGDYVVHQSHGIGMYAGIQRLEVQGATKDYLKIQYSGSDVLYVPVTQLDLLSRYTPPGDEDKVKLAKLGGAEWQRTRARVKKATEEMAQELIELYARRKQAKGFAFPPDGEWQQDFEARFEYDETEDQLPPPPRSKTIWSTPGPWTGCCAGTWGSARPRWPCGPLQVRDGGQAVRHPGPHHPAGLAALQHHPVPDGGFPRQGGAAQPLPHRQAAERGPAGPAGRQRGHRGGHPPPAVQGRPLPRPGPCHHRRGTALRRPPQGKTETELHRGGYAHPVRHPHPPHPQHGHERHPGYVHHRGTAL